MTALTGALLIRPPQRSSEGGQPGAVQASAYGTPAARLRPAHPEPPAALQQRLAEIARQYREPVGIAVTDVHAGWTASVDGDSLYPQQSVSKLWVAVTVLDAVDRGRIDLDGTVQLGEQDRSVFYQPMIARMGPEGLRITVRELLRHALAESDNAANDRLLRLVGGPEAVAETLARKGLAKLKVGAAERDLQSAIAGLEWQPQFGHGRTFQTVRAGLPDSTREAALEAYLSNPPDGVPPIAVARALGAIRRGEVLSPQSTEVMLGMMEQARTGPRRLKGGVPDDWRIAHKTGTGPDWRGASVGINDVGLLTAPDGRAYAVAVMIRKTARSVPERQAMMQSVTRAVVETWRGGD